MSESTLSYCQIADRRYEADTSAESECPYCRALAAEARAAQLEAENQRIMAEADRQIKFYQDLVHTVQAERDEARWQLEQAQQVCAYWLHDARFIVANTKEHNEAVEMLKRIVNDSH